MERRICIVGAGPVGCLAALLLARKGAQVDLLEARPEGSSRLRGEWLHPAAVAILRHVGLPVATTDPTYPTGQGFVVFPEDDSPPIPLAYLDGERGTSCEHADLVDSLRTMALQMPGVQYRPFARVTGLAGRMVTFSDRAGQTQQLTADLVVGADGRSSVVRKLAGFHGGRRRHSCMAGVVLSDANLPHEGFGHVLIGAPGPILAYRIGPRSVRLCLDVPHSAGCETTSPDYLLRHYCDRLPAEWRSEFSACVATGKVIWATNELEPHRVYGRGNVRLIGDAVGCQHPITASGLSLGFQDAVALAEHPGLAAYQRARAVGRHVAQRLASSLYAAFSRHDESTAAVRQAIYRMWREQPDERDETIRLLCAGPAGNWTLNRVLLKVALRCMQPLLRDIVLAQQWRHPWSSWQRVRRQMLWMDGQAWPR